MTEPVKIQYSPQPQSDTEIGPLTATPNRARAGDACAHLHTRAVRV